MFEEILQRLRVLEEEVTLLRAENVQLREENAVLRTENAQLRAILNKNSRITWFTQNVEVKHCVTLFQVNRLCLPMPSARM